MKRYCIEVYDSKLITNLEDTAKEQRVTPEFLIVLLLCKAMAPWSKEAKALEGEQNQ